MTMELTVEDLDSALDQVWTAGGGSSVPAEPIFCGKCGVVTDTYQSLGRYTGFTTLSKCCGHRMSTQGNIVSWCEIEEPANVV